MSSLSSGPFVSRRCIQASGIVTRPIGTFSQKIHCQAIPSTMRAADDRADRDREAGDPAPRAEDRAALLGRRVRREDRQRERRHDRGAEALDGAGDDQHLGAGRERGDHRGEP